MGVYENKVTVELLEVDKFRQIIDNLKEWIPAVESKSVASEPVSYDPEEIERQWNQVKVGFQNYILNISLRFCEL